MKKLLLAACAGLSSFLGAQSLNIDTLAFQDFEVTPAAPVWNFTGPVIYNNGYSSASATPANSPLGIGGSRAWETTVNSGGLVLDFSNTIIPAGYDSIRVRFNLAAMNLVGTGGGPDNLDYVLVAYSLDGGMTYSNRTRIRGAVNDNSTWAYSATGFAQNYYLPATEQVFQPVNSGPQTTLGYSTVEIVFPGTVTQIAMRITGRSSSSTDTWLIDNLVMTGENVCTASTSALSATVCGSYTAPSGAVFSASGIYHDTIPNSTGCDSAITINLTVNNPSTATLNANACGSYTTPSGNILSASGTYSDTIPNSAGCDSVITINLTVNAPSSVSFSASGCGSYTLPGGGVVTSSGTYMDTIPNSAGCDSVITVNVVIGNATTSSITVTSCFSYTTPSGIVLTASGTYADTVSNASGCDSVITISLAINTVDVSTTLVGATISSNAVGATYQWIDCNNGNAPVAGETNQSYLPAVNGDYAVIVTQNSCTDTSACVNVTSVDAGTSAAQAMLSVFPNPSAGIFEVRNVQAGSVITVTDVQGRAVSVTTVSGTQTQVDLSSQSSGVYFLEVNSGGNVQRMKVIRL